MGNIFLDESNEYFCPSCKNGLLRYRDQCKRIARHEGGDDEWIWIPRCKCDNPGCGKIHRMLPDSLSPHKHYSEDVICDAVDERILPEEFDDAKPSEQTIKRWRRWIYMNRYNIDGHLRSIGYRELEYSKELLNSGISLLEKLRSSIPNGWLKTIIRTIYNAGAYLAPCYD